jgi:ribosome-associated protein
MRARAIGAGVPRPSESSNAPEEAPSKSARKRSAQDLQRLGVELADLKDAELAGLPLAEDLRAALGEYRALTSHGARLRQRQYIGKLMRRADVAAIRAALEARAREHDEQTRSFHRIEAWRERLLAEGEAAIRALLATQPTFDRAELERLIHAARREADSGAPPRAARALFALLRERLAP